MIALLEAALLEARRQVERGGEPGALARLLHIRQLLADEHQARRQHAGRQTP